MNTFIQRFTGKIKGVIKGFDRIVFKGCLRPIAYADGAMAFLRWRGVLNKNYKPWMMAQSDMLTEAAGQPHPLANPEVLMRASVWHDGIRIRHWVDKNSVKLYNEHNNLRVEMTMNNPAMFRVFRRVQGKSLEPKKLLPLRKGIADIAIRAQVADNVNNRFMEQMAAVKDDKPLSYILNEISRPSIKNGRRIRALDVTGKDREFLQALSDPQFAVSGLANKNLRKKLLASPWAKDGTEKQLSARLSRHLRLMRDHGLIRKLPNQRRYLLTPQGQTLTTALNALLSASIQQLVKIAA